ncbi:Reverse transcriptase domain-containing protein [Aphis craccivora]|uniref:Reverse transcriptase domain-containing protein n=1 Tax=Aphis craccivora TaxID=307492 RepID=A0A6G0VX05_APHCR|nr:Reverse transcriptase domain-containing protein [Aphis craccivora]
MICDRNERTSNCTRGRGSLIAVKKELRPTLITTPYDTCEHVFVRLTLPSEFSVFLRGVYLPPSANHFVYESHVEALDVVWRSNNYDLDNALGVGSVDQTADFLQETLLDCIREHVPRRSFRNSTFPKWVSSNLKNLLFKKKHSHKLYKALGGQNRYLIFSRLRAQCKFESKRLYKNYLLNMQERLRVDPKSFWEFVRSKRGVSTIPDEVFLGESKASSDQVASLFASHFSSVYGDPLFTSNALSDEFTN